MQRKSTRSATERPTLVEIAQRANVSVTTVSLVLNNKAKERRLSDTVISRVLQVAEELDYAPNRLVHSMQKGCTNTMVFYNAFRSRSKHDLYLNWLSIAMELAAGRHDYDLLIHCVFNRSGEETYRHLNGGLCDGVLLFAPLTSDPLLSYLRYSRLPSVLINSADPKGVLSYVKDDHIDGLRQVADTLFKLGHRRIAALGPFTQDNAETASRIWLLRQIFTSYGITIPERWMLPTDGLEEAVEATVRLLMTDRERPTAIFCWHDWLGYRVMEQCERLGVSIPDELSIIGYDGIPWPTKSHHELASIHVDMDEIAEASVTLLEGQIKDKISGPVGKVIPVTLQYGTTLAKAPGA